MAHHGEIAERSLGISMVHFLAIAIIAISLCCIVYLAVKQL
jgi:hypothetical protein